MSLQNVELELDVNDNAVLGHASWNAAEEPKAERRVTTPPLSARVVEFIAKPGKVQQLDDCLRGQIMGFLAQHKGFSGAIILNSHQERRLILVVSFWNTERRATETCWERSRVVRQSAGCLIDACSSVRTYEAELTNSPELERENFSAHALVSEVRG